MSKTLVGVGGMGLVCSLGAGVETVFQRMCAGECGIHPIDRFPVDSYPQKSGGQVPADVEQRLRDQFPDEDFAAAMVKTAGDEALDRADAGSGAAPDPRLGLVLATNFGPLETLEWCWRERIDVGTMDPDTFAAFDDFLEATAAYFGCGGPRIQLSLSCASGGGAIALAKDWIQAGRADRVLAIGYDALTETCWCGLTNLRTITADCIRPFDPERSGTIFSEGAAAMLLAGYVSKDQSPAPLAWVSGTATNNNAYHMTAPAREAEGSRQVMAAALEDAELKPENVEHICAHATSTVANDVTEAAALRNLFGDQLDRMTVAAHKSQIGHMMGGAGLAEAITTVQVLREHRIPPTLGHRKLDPACLLDCIPGQTRDRVVSCAITNSAGLGGNNASVVLQAVS